MKNLKILYGYPSREGYNNRIGLTKARYQHIQRLKDNGFNVKPFNMGYSSNFPVLDFKQLDRKWKHKDYQLMKLYERFLEESQDCNVFYNSVGINFHPEFIENIPLFTVFGCNDDPESSENLSKPVASSYDMCAIGNIAEIDTYRSWGVKTVVWQPMGFEPDMYDKNLSYEKILNGERDIDICMIIDKLSPYRRKRLDIIDKAFPDGHFYGRGWRRGYLPMGEEVKLLQRSKIGLNIHNSTGPINSRLYYLPANGVMQICDNKKYLSEVFELGREVVGFENIEEAIELCHYYLKNEEERRIIAANGWEKTLEDYNEVAVFKRLVDNIELYYRDKTLSKGNNFHTEKQGFIDKIYISSYNKIDTAKLGMRGIISRIYHKIF